MPHSVNRRIGDVFDRLVFERIHRDDGELRAGGALHVAAIGFDCRRGLRHRSRARNRSRNRVGLSFEVSSPAARPSAQKRIASAATRKLQMTGSATGRKRCIEVTLSCQVLAAQLEAFQASEHRDRHMLGIEELLGQSLHLVGGHPLDALQHFVQ